MKIKTFFLLILGLPLMMTLGIAETPELLPLEDLAIPKSLGKVEARFRANSDRWVIQIQDVHAHLTAQQNIAAIIAHLNEVYGIKSIGIEGGWSKSSFPKSWALPASSRGKQVVADALLERDYLTGAGYAAIFAKTPIQLTGIEDEKLYEENRALYLKFLQDKDNTLQKISTLEKKINEAKSNLYNPSLFEFDKKLYEFRDGKKAESFIPFALKMAGEKSIPMDDLPELQKFSKALEMQKEIDPQKLEDEAKRLLEAHKRSFVTLEELLRSGKVPDEKLEYYPQSKLYHDLLRLQDQIPHRELFTQIEEIIKRLQDKLIQTSDERELDHRGRAFYAARKIMTLQASLEDLKAYIFYQGPLATDLTREGLTQAVENGRAFYETALKRDQIFFDKITTDPDLQGNIAIVTGGFHTEGLSEKLEKAGISYVVISPDLGEKVEPMDEKLYYERLQETVNHQTLSENQDRQLQKNIDAGVTQAASNYDTGDRNIQKAIDTALSFQSGAPSEAAASETSQDLSSITEKEWQAKIKQAQAGTQKVTAIIKLSELVAYLSDPKEGSFNHATLLAYLGNPKSILLVAKDDAEIPEVLYSNRRNVRLLQKEADKIITQEKSKLTGSDTPLAVVGENIPTEDSKVIVVKPQAGIFGALRLIVEDPNFRTASGITALMERISEILREIYRLEAMSASA